MNPHFEKMRVFEIALHNLDVRLYVRTIPI